MAGIFSKRYFLRLGTFLVLVGVTYYLCTVGGKAAAGDELGVKMELPETCMGYLSYKGMESEAERSVLPEDTEFEKRVYTKTGSGRINLGIVLTGEDRNSIHKPEICLKAQGFNIIGSSTREIRLSNGETLKVRDLDLVRTRVLSDKTTREDRSHYVYWFVGGNITTPSHTQRLLYSSLDNLIHGLNHRWAYVSVHMDVTSSYLAGGMGNEETIRIMDQMIAEAVPQFQETFEKDRSWSKWVPGL